MRRKLIGVGLIIWLLLVIMSVVGVGWYVLRIGYVVGLQRANAAVPTIGPVQGSTGFINGPVLSLLASTNCLRAGEALTLSVTLKNNSANPITLQGAPPLDIVIKPASWQESQPLPVARWSESNQYPQIQNLTLQPDEIRTFRWRWIADATFDAPHSGYKGLLIFSNLGTTDAGDGRRWSSDVDKSYIYVGFETFTGPGNSSWSCKEMQR